MGSRTFTRSEGRKRAVVPCNSIGRQRPTIFGSFGRNGAKRIVSVMRALLAGIVLLCTLSLATGDEPMGSLKLEEKTLLDATSPLFLATYQHPTGLEMIGPHGYSPDNGQTWEAMESGPDFDSRLPEGYRRGKNTPWVDPIEDRMLVLVNSMDTPDVDPSIGEPPEAMQTYYLRYRVSLDGGRTWLFDEPIVVEGEQYSPEHPFEGMYIGRNAFFLGDAGNRPIKLDSGEILVPVQATVLGPDGKLSLPGGGYYWLETIILRGTWRDDGTIAWEISERITGDPERTARGLYEGTLAQMPDGRVLCVMRGSNMGKHDPNAQWPSYKWISVSEDAGRTWSEPRPWTYADGSSFFSPSSMSQLLTHTSGRVFWLGNLTGENARGNHPRWPLVIGEVDPETLGLIRDSVIIVDTRRPDEEDVNLSHWLAFEDRQTGQIVIPMARHSAGYRTKQPVIYRVSVGP